MLDYLTVNQESLPGFEDFVKQPSEASGKPSKSKKAARNVGPVGGYAFYGNMIPMPRHSDGSPYACPCGRLYVLGRAHGGHILFDSQAPLGKGTLATLSPLRAIHHILSKGCALHERADLYRARRDH